MSSTQEQLNAIETPDENKLIIALPGSGKTHTTVSLAEKITSVATNSVLMLTFTNAAAKEMGERVALRLSTESASRVRSMTFAKLMLEHFRPLSKGRKLLMGGEQDNYIRRTAAKLNVAYDSIPIFKEYVENAGRTLNYERDSSLQSAFFIEYQNLLVMFGRVDLNMVTVEVIRALQHGLIQPLSYTHYLVDEFQDTDSQQYEWMLTHKVPGKFFCVVGDDDQSIYSWRGAVGYENMRKYRQDFSASTYTLSLCFRCSPYILGAAQRLIENSTLRLPKNMRSAKSELGRVECLVNPADYKSEYSKKLQCKDTLEIKQKTTPKNRFKSKNKVNYEPYRFVVDQVEADFQKWAILARMNVHLDQMELVLAERNIPVLRLGGKSIFDTPHAVGIIKLMYGLSNPRAADHLADGLGWLGEELATVHAIYHAAKGIGFGSMSGFGKSKWLKETTEFQVLAHEWHPVEQTELETDSRINRFFTILNRSIEHHEEADHKSQLAISAVCQRVLTAAEGNLNERVKSLLDLIIQGASKNSKKPREGKIVLCTLTGSKGLEFPNVFIINVDKGVIPILKEDEECPDEKIEEERRLLYVGMTRAEDRLVLCYTENKPSMYISELGF